MHQGFFSKLSLCQTLLGPGLSIPPLETFPLLRKLNEITVLSKSLGFEMREFRSLFSRTFVESSLQSSRETSRM